MLECTIGYPSAPITRNFTELFSGEPRAITLIRCSFEGITSDLPGSAIAAMGYTLALDVVQCSFLSCTTSRDGGAIHAYLVLSVELNYSTIYCCSAKYFAAFYLQPISYVSATCNAASNSLLYGSYSYDPLYFESYIKGNAAVVALNSTDNRGFSFDCALSIRNFQQLNLTQSNFINNSGDQSALLFYMIGVANCGFTNIAENELSWGRICICGSSSVIFSNCNFRSNLCDALFLVYERGNAFITVDRCFIYPEEIISPEHVTFTNAATEEVPIERIDCEVSEVFSDQNLEDIGA
jgi:hypothetical protein